MRKKTKWLIIGNSQYDDPSINNVLAVSESVELLSTAVKDTFGDFADVTVKKDLHTSEFLHEIVSLYSNASDVIPVFYFCGHGYRSNNSLLLAVFMVN